MWLINVNTIGLEHKHECNHLSMTSLGVTSPQDYELILSTCAQCAIHTADFSHKHSSVVEYPRETLRGNEIPD